MSGKLVGILLVLFSLAFGGALYWVQVYGHYTPISTDQTEQLTLVNMTTGEAEPLAYDGFEGIDGDATPIKYRACFNVAMSDATLSETYESYETPTPLIAPKWFDCFDAREIGAALEEGRAMAFLSQKEIHDGVDRVIAVYPDGRAYAWHQLNEKYQDDGNEPLD